MRVSGGYDCFIESCHTAAQGIKVTENSLTCGFRMKEKKKQITKGVDEMITMKITEMNPTYEEWESYFIFKSKKTDNVIFDEGYTQEKDGTTTFRQGFTVNASEKDYLNFLRWLKQQRKGKKGKK
jgi:hypothetical protein